VILPKRTICKNVLIFIKKTSQSCHLKSEKLISQLEKNALYCEFAKTIDNKNLKPTFMQNLVKEEEE